MKLADIYKFNSGKKKVVFFEMGLYELLKNTLGYRYAKINNKGYYLQEVSGIYKKVDFHKLKDSLRKYLEDSFENLDEAKEIEFHDFMNAYLEKSPVKNGNYAREYLSEDFELSDYNRHLILLEIDPDYSRQFRRNEMLTFLKEEAFIETVDKMGNFYKGCRLFYKKVSEDCFLIFYIPLYDINSKKTTFDFYEIKANSEKEFLSKKTTKQLQIMLGFDLLRDIDIYRVKTDNIKTLKNNPINGKF